MLIPIIVTADESICGCDITLIIIKQEYSSAFMEMIIRLWWSLADFGRLQ